MRVEAQQRKTFTHVRLTQRGVISLFNVRRQRQAFWRARKTLSTTRFEVLKPDSASVGTSGNTAFRLRLAIARTFSVPVDERKRSRNGRRSHVDLLPATAAGLAPLPPDTAHASARFPGRPENELRCKMLGRAHARGRIAEAAAFVLRTYSMSVSR